MKPMIAVTDGMDKKCFEELQSYSEFEVFPKAKLTPEEIESIKSKVQGMVIRSSTKPNAEFLSQCPELKYIIRAGEGVDNIDLEACKAKGIAVSNTPGANNNSAAEHAISLMFTLLRKTAYANASMQNKKWEKPLFVGNEMTNKKIGIIGMGRIGTLVAKRLAGFEPDVLYFDNFVPKSDLPYVKKTEDINEIFKTCDIITLHVPLLEQTKNMVGAEQLAMMKSSALLINAARGGIIDEQALYNALKNNQIAGAGLDVFAQEPLNTDSNLYELENLVMTPHLGASTKEAQQRVGKMCLDQLREFFINNSQQNKVC